MRPFSPESASHRTQKVPEGGLQTVEASITPAVSALPLLDGVLTCF
jgi:hypothetical protein